MPLLIDLTQTIIANVVVHFRDDLKKDPKDAKNLIKHSLFNTLLSYKKNYGKEYGELVLACDSKKYWRRDYFPAYKGHRKHDREASDMNWDVVFETINEIKSDLREYFNYKVIEVEGAEADDVIACITKYLQDNELVQEGLFDGEPQKVLVCSADTDFVQLQKYKGVKQWSSIQKKWVKPKVSIPQFIMEHVCTGDSGDNIPNILTPDTWAIDRSNGDEAIRQTPMRKQRLSKFVENGIAECNTNEERRNFIRNQTLIDFDKIPDRIYNSIIDEYKNYKSMGNKTKLLQYFTQNKMKMLFAEIANF